MKSSYLYLIFFALIACSSFKSDPQTEENNSINKTIEEDGIWRFSFQIRNKELPFLVDFKNTNTDNSEAIIHQGERTIVCKDFKIDKDSIFITIPTYNTFLKGRIESEDLITGEWYNPVSDVDDNYTLPFIAEKGKDYKFTPAPSDVTLPGRYKITMQAGSDRERTYVLKIKQTPEKVSASIMTESGDYGFLEGNISNDMLYLSSFDGGYAYLFTALINGDSLTDGKFYSGYHHKSDWYAAADTTFKLRDPKSLTYLKEGYNQIDFKLPNQDGDTVTWTDLNLDNKVVILDIMGSWCPNCLDAGVAIKELTAKYDKNDIETISIAFERTDDLEEARKRVFNVQEHLGLEKKFLFGGKVSRENTEKALPMLNRVMSYPTIIFIDKNRNIEEIYTGFYGPGTGEKYIEFMDQTQEMLDSMVEVEK